jgi:hypothetical protein
VFCSTPSDIVMERASFCITAKSEHIESLTTFVLSMFASERPSKSSFHIYHVMVQVSWTIRLQFFTVSNKNLTPNPITQQSSTTKWEEESEVDQLGARRTRCLSRREVWLCANHSTNPFYSEHPLDATTHERHNNLTLVQLVLRGSLGNEEVRRVVEWSSICNLFCWYMWSSRGFDAEMSSYTRLWTIEMQQPHLERIQSTEQVTPSWLGFEACNSLGSLLLHWSKVDFN